MTINRFLAAKLAKSVSFMGLKIEIIKLSYRQTIELREIVVSMPEVDQAQEREKLLLDFVIKNGAPELANIEDLTVFPVDELERLAGEIISFSGLNFGGGKVDPKASD